MTSRMLRVVPIAALAAGSLVADVVIPSAAFVSGANNALFQSDVRVFNPTSSPVNVTPTFYNVANGQTVTKAVITVPARAQVKYDNVLQSLFEQGTGSFGPVRFQTSGPIIVSSGVNNVNACTGGGSGQWLPGIDVGQALKAGTLVQLASSVDTNAGFRTNLVFVNPGTANANVTVKVRKGDGSQLSSATLAPLGSNGFKQINNWADLPGVAGTADTNLWVEFTSDQPVLAFASVINNASGDPFAIVATPEPGTTAAPVASYTFAPASPKAGDVVTFTDTSTGSPTSQLWAFGDGTTATSGTTATKTYSAAGTYKTAHFVTNSAGASSAVKDVVVAAVSSAPETINITASQFTFTPNTVALQVGKTYKIVFTSSDVTHGAGIGGTNTPLVVLLGSAFNACNVMPRNQPCTVDNVTPTAAQVGTYSYACSQSSCGAGHGSMTGKFTVSN